MKEKLDKEELLTLRCVKCGKEVKPFWDDEEYPANPNEINFLGAIVGTIDAGYGSAHDGNIFTIGICDQCL